MWAPPCIRKHLALILYLTYSQGTFCVLLRNGVEVSHGNKSFASSRNYLNIQQHNSTIHAWEQHFNTVPPCTQKSLDELTTGKWYITKNGRYLFEPDTCVLRRITGESARRYVGTWGVLTYIPSQITFARDDACAGASQANTLLFLGTL